MLNQNVNQKPTPSSSSSTSTSVSPLTPQGEKGGFKPPEENKAADHIKHLDEVSNFFKFERVKGSSAIEKLFAMVEADRAEFSDEAITAAINRCGKKAKFWTYIHDQLADGKSAADKSACKETAYQERLEREHEQRELEMREWEPQRKQEGSQP